jgi:hypothetical protein
VVGEKREEEAAAADCTVPAVKINEKKSARNP